jgi:mannose-6-phosphate isomerase-like protein (cupin superfamily)
MPVLRAPVLPTHDLDGVCFTSLATPRRGSTDTAVWRVEIDANAPTSPHTLTREEVFVVLEGHATVRIADQRAVAESGDAIVVPPHTDFELANAGPGPLRLLCCMPVGGQAVMDGVAFTPPWAE